MKKEKIKEMLIRYQAGQCTEEEKAWIETWYNNLIKDTATDLSADVIEKDLYEVYNTLPRPNKVKIINSWSRIAASVFLVFSLSAGLYIYLKRTAESTHVNLASLKINKVDFAPEVNRTFLTLDNGSKILLTHAAIGKIAEEGGMNIMKIKEGVIAYTSISKLKNVTKAPKINIITTSKGGQCQIILPDGSSVWLNAVSSLKFPTSFLRKRRVELKGEGYFEVTKNKALPFKVLTEHQEVEVLGTHFNINSYDDEPVTKTTLLEGSVKISQLKTRRSALLKPGEQSTLKNEENIRITHVNTDNAIAWKSGLFQFQDADIKNMVRQLARWYDMDFEFEGPVPDIKLWGEVHRNTDALKALEILSYFDLNYRIVNAGIRKKVIITK